MRWSWEAGGGREMGSFSSHDDTLSPVRSAAGLGVKNTEREVTEVSGERGSGFLRKWGVC